MSDKLRMEAINALAHPLTARFIGGSRWPIYDIDVGTGLTRIDVMGKLDIKHFCEVTALIDDYGQEHDPETFWTDYEATP